MERKAKKYILRFNQSNADSVYSFGALRRGAKRIETRAATEKYRRIRAGDTLVFVCGENKFERRVKKTSLFRSINAMLRKYRVKDIMPDRFLKKELENAYNSYTGYKDKIKRFGLVAFEIG